MLSNENKLRQYLQLFKQLSSCSWRESNETCGWLALACGVSLAGENDWLNGGYNGAIQRISQYPVMA